MLEDALNYPFRGEDSTERLVVGGALPFLAAAIYVVGLLLLFIFVGVFVVPLAIVPRVLLWGYLVTVVAAVLAGRTEPPGFDNWKRIGVDGLKAVLVTLGYSIPLVVLIFVVVAVTALTGVAADQAGGSGLSTVTGLVWVGFGLLTVLYSLVMYYVLPAAIVNYVRMDDVSAAFHLRTVKEIVVDGDYLVAWLLAAVVLTVGSLIAIPLYFVLVGFVLRFYVFVVAAFLVTRGSMESMGWTAPLGPDAATAGAADSAPPDRPGSSEPEPTDPLTDRTTEPDTRGEAGHGTHPRDENDAPRDPESDGRRDGE